MSKLQGILTKEGVFYENPSKPNFNVSLNYYPKDLRYSFTYLEAPGFDCLRSVKIEKISGKSFPTFLILDPTNLIDSVECLEQAHKKAHDHMCNYIKKVFLAENCTMPANVLDTTVQGRKYFEANRQLEIPFLE
jgi:hypothetical protein